MCDNRNAITINRHLAACAIILFIMIIFYIIIMISDTLIVCTIILHYYGNIHYYSRYFDCLRDLYIIIDNFYAKKIAKKN